MGKSGERLQRNLGRAIRSRREDAGLSQEALAERASVHRTYVSMLERGIGNPTVGVLADLADVLGVRVSDLVREAESR